MSETARQPLKGITPGQLRALAAIAAARGWDRSTLRDICGVKSSLKELSVSQASAVIDRIQRDGHRTKYEPPPPDRTAVRGVIRMASDRQRNKIQSLLDDLGWPPDKAAGWLTKRHGIRELAGGVFSTAAASEVIVQLEKILAKGDGQAEDFGDE